MMCIKGLDNEGSKKFPCPEKEISRPAGDLDYDVDHAVRDGSRPRLFQFAEHAESPG